MLRRSRFFFLRHGETDWNKEQRAQGQRDVPLNAAGLRQARRARALVADLQITTICASPRRRAMETAGPLRESLGCELRVVDELAECAWGDREGDIKGQWFEDWKSGEASPRGAETYEGFLKRALEGINRCLEEPGPVLIVSHGGVYWAVQKYAALGPELDIPNAIPVRHDPPTSSFPWWTATVLESGAAPTG